MSESQPLTEVAFQKFIEAEYSRLVRAVAVVSGSATAAEDAVQEALARAWQRTERGEVIESLGKWTATVALNLARTGRRRARLQRKLWPRIAERSEGPQVDHAAILDLRRGLELLPRRQKEATVLFYYLGWSVNEIAAVLGVSDGTVKTALHRARAALAPYVRDFSSPEEVSNAGDP